MFKVFCDRHGSEVLLSWDNIVSVVNGTDRVEMEWECYYGQHGRFASAHRHAPVAA
jgi:hypothetical protein